MAISLSKGGNVSLSKEDPSLTQLILGLGWSARVTDGEDFDLDVSLFLLGENDKVLSDNHFVFYGNKKSPDGSIEHMGDNRTGDGEGDDEQIKINLTKVSSDIKRIVATVTIHKATERGQNFGQVSNSYIRVLNELTNVEIAKYDLNEDYSTQTAMIFGEIYRHGNDWKFKAVGDGFSGGLEAMCGQYGVNIE